MTAVVAVPTILIGEVGSSLQPRAAGVGWVYPAESKGSVEAGGTWKLLNGGSDTEGSVEAGGADVATMSIKEATPLNGGRNSEGSAKTGALSADTPAMSIKEAKLLNGLCEVRQVMAPGSVHSPGGSGAGWGAGCAASSCGALYAFSGRSGPSGAGAFLRHRWRQCTPRPRSGNLTWLTHTVVTCKQARGCGSSETWVCYIYTYICVCKGVRRRRRTSKQRRKPLWS